MNIKAKKLYQQNKKRYKSKFFGIKNKPRLSVFKSNKHVYAQIIDDIEQKTLVSCSTVEKVIKNSIALLNNRKASFLVGNYIGRKALRNGIFKIQFDRVNKKYIGRIQALIEGIRNSGLYI